MKKFSTRNNIIAGFLIAFACVGYFVWTTYRNMKQTETESRNVRSALQVLLVLETVENDLQEMESGQRNYMQAGNGDFIEPFNRALLAIKQDSITLSRIELHDSTRNTELSQLLLLINQKAANSKEMIRLRDIKAYDPSLASMASTKGKQIMDNIRELIFSLENKDRILLRESNLKREAIARQTARQFFLLAFAFFIILLLNYLIISDDLKKQHRTTVQLNYHASLINNISDPIVTTDKNYCINGWNKHAEELYGWTQAEVMGKHPGDIFRLKYVNTVAENVLEEFKKIGNWKGEVIHYKKNGEPINIYISTTSLKDEAGNITGTVALIRDTTEVVKAREEVNFLASLVEQTSDAIISTKRDTTIITWNKGAERMYGYSRDEVVGKRFPEVSHSGLTMQQIKEIEKELDQKGFWEHELVHWRKDHTSFHCLLSATIVRKESGESNECVMVVRDITERKKLEEQLQQFNQELALQVKIKTAELTSTFERITDAFIALDKNWNYTYLNSRAGKMHGKEPEELVGKNIWNAFPEVVNEPFYKALHKAMETQQATELDLYYSKTDTWFRDFIYPSPDGVSIYYQDITSKKKAEEQVVKEIELSNSIVNSLPGIFYLYDEEGKAVRWNKNFEAVSGYTAEEIGRMHPFEFFDTEDQKSLSEKVAKVFEQGRAEVETNFLTKDKRKIPYYFNGVAANFEGKVCLVGMGIDITERKKAEQELYKSELRYRSLVEQASDGILISDQNGKYIDVNSSACKLLGYTREEFLKMGSEDILYNKEQVKELESRYAQLKAGKSFISERILQRKDGSPVTVETNAQMLPDGRFIGILRDITERKEAEKKIIAEKDISNSIINSLPGIFYLYDQTGKFIRWNKNFEEVSGYSAEEVAQMHPLDFFAEEEKGLLTERIGSVFEKGMAEVEAHFFTKKRQKIPYYFNGWAANFEGKVCLIGMGIDITERKKAESEIIQNEEKLNRAQQIAKIGSWEFNLLSKEVVWSKELFRIFELDEQPSDKLYEAYRRRLHPADLPKLDRLISRSIERGEGYEWQHRIICNDGSIRHILGIGEVVKNDDGKVIGLKGTGQDITERKKSEEQLRQSFREIRQLATHLQDIREQERTTIAREIHDELGQQLTGLKMDLSWLSKKIAAQDEEIKNKFTGTIELIDNTVKSVRRIATELRPSILDDLGLIAAMEWQSIEFEKRSGISTEFINKTGNMNIPSAIATGLFRIFQESLTNVARHSMAKNIKSSLLLEEGILVLTIADDGNGFIVDEIGGKKTLGLLGMKERTNIMGGKYEIKSAPGEGTVVTVTIPLQA